MTKNEILRELHEQDKLLKKIFDRREELAELAGERYDEIWEKLYSDGESHYDF